MANLRVNKIAAVGVSTENTGSVFFDGTDDHLNVTSSDIVVGTGDFTLEFFVNFSSADATLDTIMDTRTGTGASNGFLIGRFHSVGHENKEQHWIEGANHYYFGQPEKSLESAKICKDWMKRTNLLN